MNRRPEQSRSHPLRMMAADYDRESRGTDNSRHHENPYHRAPRHKGGAKGRNASNRHSQSTNIDDFILPEMTEDPWVGIYSRLSPSVRVRETLHLGAYDRERVESGVPFFPTAKRPNLD